MRIAALKAEFNSTTFATDFLDSFIDGPFQHTYRKKLNVKYLLIDLLFARDNTQKFTFTRD
jgi:hypothetical protein